MNSQCSTLHMDASPCETCLFARKVQHSVRMLLYSGADGLVAHPVGGLLEPDRKVLMEPSPLSELLEPKDNLSMLSSW